MQFCQLPLETLKTISALRQRRIPLNSLVS